MRSPLIIAHRGASGLRPEHTISAYKLAIEQGADFIEPDLVLTKDGHLVCRHENEIGGTTNVASHAEFADRKTSRTIDGEQFEGWFTEDFTLAEIKTLRCRERLPQLRSNNVAYDGRDEILTFDEVVSLAQSESIRLGRTIGVYPETKHPTWFAGLGMRHDEALVAALKKFDLDRSDAPVFVQSFEVNNLKRLRSLTRAPLIQLMSEEGGPADLAYTGVSYASMASDAGLKEVATYAAGIGVQKSMIVPRDTANNALTPTDLVTRAHKAGLAVHPWTFRAENYFLANQDRRGDSASADYLRQQGDLESEIALFMKLGVDGVFADFPAIAVQVREAQ